MTDKEILIKTIEKAFPDSIAFTTVMLLLDEGDNFDMFDVRGYLTDHRFAKAFWGKNHYVRYEEGFIDPNELYTQKDRDDNDCNWIRYQPLWQYHLQKMVLEENPIKYLEQFL